MKKMLEELVFRLSLLISGMTTGILLIVMIVVEQQGPNYSPQAGTLILLLGIVSVLGWVSAYKFRGPEGPWPH